MTVIVHENGVERRFDRMQDACDYMDARDDFEAWVYEGQTEMWPEQVHEFGYVGTAW